MIFHHPSPSTIAMKFLQCSNHPSSKSLTFLLRHHFTCFSIAGGAPSSFKMPWIMLRQAWWLRDTAKGTIFLEGLKGFPHSDPNTHAKVASPKKNDTSSSNYNQLQYLYIYFFFILVAWKAWSFSANFHWRQLTGGGVPSCLLECKPSDGWSKPEMDRRLGSMQAIFKRIPLSYMKSWQKIHSKLKGWIHQPLIHPWLMWIFEKPNFRMLPVSNFRNAIFPS